MPGTRPPKSIFLIGSCIHSTLYAKALDDKRGMPNQLGLSSSHWHVCSMVMSNSSIFGSGSPDATESDEPNAR